MFSLFSVYQISLYSITSNEWFLRALNDIKCQVVSIREPDKLTPQSRIVIPALRQRELLVTP